MNKETAGQIQPEPKEVHILENLLECWHDTIVLFEYLAMDNLLPTLRHLRAPEMAALMREVARLAALPEQESNRQSERKRAFEILAPAIEKHARELALFERLDAARSREGFEYIEITQGNLDNQHIYLTSIIGMFPSDAIGGSSDAERAPKQLEVHCGVSESVFTDIAGDKKIFRKRAWVGEFFRMHRLEAGDRVIVERTGDYRYHVYPARVRF